MKVQRIRLSNTDQVRWVVLDDDFVPIQPILSYLMFLDDLDRSPNTIRTIAHHLKQFWEYLHDAHLCWTEIDIVQFAGFITWLRRPDPSIISIEWQQAKRTNATIDQMVGSVQCFYVFHARLGTVPALPLYQLSMPYRRRYKPFLHGIAKAKPEFTRVVSVKRERRKPKTLTQEQVQTLIAACTHTRDKFLLMLMYQTGMRVGQCLGLKHEDLNVEDGEIHIVPRDGNPNGARAKSRDTHTIPGLPDLMSLYTDYLIDDLGALEADALPDFLFVNLFAGEIGHPMTYASVMSLVKKLIQRTGIRFTPHMFRHTRATTWIRDDNLPIAVVSRLLTHVSIQTTNDTYLQLSPEDLKRALMNGRERRHGDIPE
ncbi:transposase [Dictyobacter sp. S3.2.2.5]|uniref:Transposase n=1 Tax=Dictyobacter halimunensis TaxID=3026934 RepID=A0ABQ6G4X4_9CHLR|nr:transposase [Dictyobacter sp. S3.2.2.5]